MLFFSPCTLMMFGGLVHNKKKKKNIRILKSTPIYQQYGESPSPRISDVCEFEAKKLRLLHFY
jgi:hypothetical protein